MSCRHLSCSCKCYKQSSSKWSRNKCNTCNHPQKEHSTNNPSNANTFAIGSKCEVLYENEWWTAEIINTTEQQIEITYEEWDEFSNEWIDKSSHRLRLKRTKIELFEPKQQNEPVQASIANRRRGSSVLERTQQFLTSVASNNNKRKKPAAITNKFSTGDCALCAGTNLANIITLTNCEHKLCKECMNNYIRISSTDKLNIKCPFCACSVDRYKDVKIALSHQEFYDIYLRPNLKKCLSANCTNNIKLIGTGAARLDCVKCEKSWCVHCNVPWHENMDCDAYKHSEAYMLSERQFQSYLNEKSGSIKKCPKCSVDIEKNNGCNHIHCVSCNVHFCWKCLFSAGDGGSIYAHMSNCR